MLVPKFLLIPLIAALATQMVKFFTPAWRGRSRWSAFHEYGGMPSAHTAFVVSLTTVIGLSQGWTSAIFAVSAAFSFLTIRDAIGLRQSIGLHGSTLKKLIQGLPEERRREFAADLTERFGHTPLQAVVGGLIGLALAIVLNRWIV